MGVRILFHPKRKLDTLHFVCAFLTSGCSLGRRRRSVK
jgi:hypothetical protein